MASWLISNGADVNHVNKRGLSVLCSLIHYNRGVNKFDLARQLIEAGADVDFRVGPDKPSLLEQGPMRKLPEYGISRETLYQYLKKWQEHINQRE